MSKKEMIDYIRDYMSANAIDLDYIQERLLVDIDRMIDKITSSNNRLSNTPAVKAANRSQIAVKTAIL